MPLEPEKALGWAQNNFNKINYFPNIYELIHQHNATENY